MIEKLMKVPVLAGPELAKPMKVRLPHGASPLDLCLVRGLRRKIPSLVRYKLSAAKYLSRFSKHRPQPSTWRSRTSRSVNWV